jgi:hypothetical protein
VTSKSKIVKKLLNNPKSVRYSEIETIFINDDRFEIKRRKWSHKSIVNIETWGAVIITLHWKDCEDVYKDKLKKFYITNFKIYE